MLTTRTIAIWGMGVFGQKMLIALKEYYSDVYSVAALFDRSPKKSGTEYEGLLIKEPSEIKKEYAAGLFEAVMVCIKFGDARTEAVRSLQEWGIPLFYPGTEDSFTDHTQFEQTESPSYQIDQKGYDVWEFTNIFGIKALHFDSESMFLFNEEGKVLLEQWDAYPEDAQYALRLYFPIRFDQPPAEKVMLRGEWCILTKLFAGNYWHFVNEGMDCVALLEEAGYTGKYLVPDCDFNKELLVIMGIDENRICSAADLDNATVYQFEKLVFCHQRKRNYRESADVLSRVGDRLKKHLKTDSSLPKRIHIKRIGSRKLLNGEEISSQYGFVTIIPEEYSVKEQMEFFYNADIVLSEHGANSTNYVCMRPGSVFVETFNNSWKYPFNLYGTYACGIHYLPVSDLKPADNDPQGKTKDYKIDETMLRTSIENAILISKGDKLLYDKSIRNHSGI